ncbi:SDR family NAD(P)-dependent oxidoreductase [Micromonospora musae]|uniref:SDR family NAD(P)-dependent oxidoreductase n=1 Tax=Micromonospora musae TaxID=1894970 RepID=UPI0033F0DB13
MVSSTVALVTGANKGLGVETARQLGQRGAAVLLGSRDPDRGEAADAVLGKEGLDVTAVTLDVNDAAAVRALADRLRDEHGRLDILVNNAGTDITHHGSSRTAAEGAHCRTAYRRSSRRRKAVEMTAVNTQKLPAAERTLR